MWQHTKRRVDLFEMLCFTIFITASLLCYFSYKRLQSWPCGTAIDRTEDKEGKSVVPSRPLSKRYLSDSLCPWVDPILWLGCRLFTHLLSLITFSPASQLSGIINAWTWLANRARSIGPGFPIQTPEYGTTPKLPTLATFQAFCNSLTSMEDNVKCIYFKDRVKQLWFPITRAIMAASFTILTSILDICGPFTGIQWKKNKHLICRPRSVRIGKNWVSRPLTVFPNADLSDGK